MGGKEMKLRKIGFMGLVLTLGLAVVGCTSKPVANESGSNQTIVDEIKVAYPVQPPTLDPQITTAVAAKDLARPIFETLFTLNSKYQAVPMLAEKVEQSDGGKTYTFTLRKGIKFHNGKELTAADVVASMNRWVEKNGATKTVIGSAKFVEKDNNTVAITLDKPSLDLLLTIASAKQYAGIMPKEVIESSDSAKGITTYIGTGPYKLVEWKQDQYVLYTKFDDYKPLDSAPDGLAGKKEAMVKNLRVSFVTDLSTREIGLQSGEYDIANNLQPDSYEKIKKDSSIKTFQFINTSMNLVFNKKSGPFTNLKLRQAVNAALDFDQIFKANPGIPEFYRIDSNYMFKEQTDWYFPAPAGLFNQKNPEKAKQLLAEGGYDGKEIRFMTTRDYPYYYDHAVVIKDQLEKIGMKVKLDVYDWTTLTDLRNKPDKWELINGGFSLVTTPSTTAIFNPSYFGWTSDDKLTQKLAEMTTAGTLDEEKQKWKEAQQLAWDYLPIIKYGDLFAFTATTKKVEGYEEFEGVKLWNIKVFK
jgi:peptide/nickel transport system substrate-binding protein